MDKNIDIEVDEVYASVSANSQENSISCQGKYLLYSRCNCPVLYNLEQNKVVSLPVGHSDKINNLHFVDTTLFDQEALENIYIISTSHDRTAIVRQYDPKINKSDILYQFTAPNESSFTSSCSFRDQDGNFLTITTSIDCSICLWLNAELTYILETKYCCFEVKLYTTLVNGLKYKFLFLAGSDNKIRVFHVNSKSLDFLFELLGHSDWIKCIDVVSLADRELEFLMASSSQDSYVRVWYMKLVDCDLDLSQQIRTIVSKPLQIDEGQNYRLTATLETVLSGHEGIVYGLCWFKKLAQPALQLISCSADKTIIIWRSSIASIGNDMQERQRQLNKYDQCSASVGIWQQIQRFGETGETNLPFLGVCLSEDESTFYAISLRGAIHSWALAEQTSNTDCWMAQPAILGHFGPISDLSWEKSGAYLLSASLDKTCRLHAISSIDNKWHELARPQVHGHEINCLVSIDSIRFASGAEEKTVRAFKATRFFLKNFKHLAAAELNLQDIDQEISSLSLHAQLPALGLSNKAAKSPYGDVDSTTGSDNQESGASSNWYAVSKLVDHLAKIDHLDSLPIEEILLQSTLWVETHKLFGHGNELYALAVDSKGSYLASASRANRADLASVLIWDCTKFRKNASIEHHSLTVTRLRFSPDDRYLLSVSRDRTWCLSKRTENPKPRYEKMIGTTKSNAIHERIIWDCCWTCDSRYFITVSRDKKAVIWSADLMQEQAGKQADQQNLSSTGIQSFECSIQAVDCLSVAIESDRATKKSYLVAFGLEDGTLNLYLISIESINSSTAADWRCIKWISNYHHLPIRRLAFRPENTSTEITSTTGATKESDTCDRELGKNHNQCLLASGSDDCIVKLTRVSVSSM